MPLYVIFLTDCLLWGEINGFLIQKCFLTVVEAFLMESILLHFSYKTYSYKMLTVPIQLDHRLISWDSVTHHPIDSVQCSLSKRAEIKEIITRGSFHLHFSCDEKGSLMDRLYFIALLLKQKDKYFQCILSKMRQCT